MSRRRRWLLLVVLSSLLLGGLSWPAPAANAATITVTSPGDTETAGDDQCTLREAIKNANATADTTAGDCVVGSGTDTIAFAIAGSGVRTIAVTSPLPPVTDAVVVDGWSQGGGGYTGPPLIELNGAAAGLNVHGLQITGGSSTIRGLVVNGFSGVGILLSGAGGNTIQGNRIGTDPTGASAVPNYAGVSIVGAANNVVGGTADGAGNLISGNLAAGVSITSSATGNQVQGNLIGTNAAGTTSVGNTDGVLVENAPGNTVGGTASAARNIISGNHRGIYIRGASATANLVQNNYVGANLAGTGVLGNYQGVALEDAPGNTIGGTTDARNVISGNGTGILIFFNGATGNLVQGNHVGANAAGDAGVPNGIGVWVSAPANTIGGTVAGTANLISGNTDFGIQLAEAAIGNLVQGNRIGTNAAGSGPLPNGSHGVFADAGAANTTIGGTVSGVGNVVAFNGGAGVLVGTGTGHLIQRNAIFSNGALGIDLGPAGITPNDPGDGDAGANALQNFPIVTSAGTRGASTVVAGRLNSTPSTNGFRLELFASPACEPSGNGEGQTFLGSTDATTDGSGNASFVVTLPAVPVGQIITTTATHPASGTSEFSACRSVLPTGITVTPTSGLTTTEAGGTATFAVALDTVPSGDVTIALSSSDATEGTVAPASLTFTPANALTPRAVTITGLDDGVVDGNVAYTIVTASATSADPGYNGLNPPDVATTNLDNDAPSCSPRPRVVVATANNGDGRLRVTVTATTQPPGQPNRLVELRFQAARSLNGLVDVAGQSGLTGSFTFPLPDRPSSVTFFVRRAIPSQPTTVSFVVVDDCGEWQTFAGGGPGAF